MRLLAVTVVIAAAGIAVGCGSPEPTKPPNPIPQVDNPRDVTAVAGRPCDLLSEAQASQFGLDQPPRQLPGFGRGKVDCEWRSSQADVWVYVSMSPDRSTLEEVYGRRGSLPAFELTKVAGYPATASRVDAQLPVCDVDIKAADTQSVTVTYDSTKLNSTPQQGCVVAKEVAQAVLKNLPAQRG